MNVVDVPRVIFVIPYDVLPETALPDSAFAFGDPHRRTSFAGRQGAHETYLDGLDAIRIVIIAGR
ncbi:MAG: hypothetical protein FD165_2292 [Gammaproteobacteria bacterium]|nr:MAG: hypothetical protein FD165_2292 [Gammaproteobacteria bacterium]